MQNLQRNDDGSGNGFQYIGFCLSFGWMDYLINPLDSQHKWTCAKVKQKQNKTKITASQQCREDICHPWSATSNLIPKQPSFSLPHEKDGDFFSKVINNDVRLCLPHCLNPLPIQEQKDNKDKGLLCSEGHFTERKFTACSLESICRAGQQRNSCGCPLKTVIVTLLSFTSLSFFHHFILKTSWTSGSEKINTQLVRWIIERERNSTQRNLPLVIPHSLNRDHHGRKMRRDRLGE